MIGTWIQQIAQSWLVHRLTGSPFLLGVTSFASQFPILLLAPVAGLISDRVDRKRLLIVTQSLLMLQALVLATLTLSGSIQMGALAFSRLLARFRREIRPIYRRLGIGAE